MNKTNIELKGDITPNQVQYVPGNEVYFKFTSNIVAKSVVDYSLTYQNPVFYFKAPEIFISNLTADDFKVTTKNNEVLNPIITPFKNKKGENFFKIEFLGEKGSKHSFYQSYYDLDDKLYDNNTGLTIEISDKDKKISYLFLI